MSIIDKLEKDLKNIPIYTVKERKCIQRLDLNENLIIPGELLKKIIMEAISDIDPRTYPGKEKMEAEEALANYHSVDRDQIILTNGADEAIDTLLNIVKLTKPEDATILTLKPSFSIYRMRALLKNLKHVEVKIDKETLKPNIDELYKRSKNAHLVLLDIPNNPTGIVPLTIDEVIEVAYNTMGVVAVDEVYAMFTNRWGSEKLIGIDSNIVIIRSFSKSHGLAGMRIGYIVAPKKLSNILKRQMLPFHVNKLALKLVVKILKYEDLFKSYLKQAVELREYMYRKLSDINGIRVFPSHTNFILMEAGVYHNKIIANAISKGYCIREFKDQFENGDKYIRITVPPKKEVIDKLIEIIREAIETS